MTPSFLDEEQAVIDTLTMDEDAQIVQIVWSCGCEWSEPAGMQECGRHQEIAR